MIRVNPKFSDQARIYVKGAPEEVVDLCTSILTKVGTEREMRKEDKNALLNLVVS